MKNIKLFIILTLITILVGWSILSLYVIIRDKGRQDVYENVVQSIYNLAANDIINTIKVGIENRGEIGIDIKATETTPARRMILIEKVTSDPIEE